MTRNDGITNEYIRRTAHVKQFDEKRLRGKTKIAWTCAEEGWIYSDKSVEDGAAGEDIQRVGEMEVGRRRGRQPRYAKEHL